MVMRMQTMEGRLRVFFKNIGDGKHPFQKNCQCDLTDVFLIGSPKFSYSRGTSLDNNNVMWICAWTAAGGG